MKSSKSLRGKFMFTMLLVTSIIGVATLSLVAVLSAQASSHDLATVRAHIEAGIRSKGRVLTENHAIAMRTMVLDNAFLDMQRLVQRAVAGDEDLVYGIYVNNEKRAVAYCQRGFDCRAERVVDREIWRPLGLTEPSLLVSGQVVQAAHRLNEDLLEVAMPVRGEDQEILGTIRYGLSTKRMQDALAQAQREAGARLRKTLWAIGGIVGLATLLGLILSRFQAVRITRPVIELTEAAKELAGGNRSVRVKIASGDELEALGGSFNRMVQELDASYSELEEMNRTLEQKVQARTAELALKNRDMRLVLDNVDQGFITIQPEGVMAKERSRVVDEWFGPCERDTTFAEYMGRHSRVFGVEFQLAWDQVVEGFLPLELTLDQLPTALTLEDKTFSLRYLPFLKGHVLEGVLVVIADISERLAKEREEAEQNELMQGFKRVMLDRSGFSNFMREATGMIEAICTSGSSDLAALKRTLHTVKGNTAAMGLLVVARLCNSLEDQLRESGCMLDATLEELAERWNTILDHVANFVGRDTHRVIEVPQSEYAAMVSSLTAADGCSDVLNRLLAWQLEPVERAFERLADQGRALAKRLGKGELDISIEGNGVRLDPDTWTPFFSVLTHVVRNSIDHGIEPSGEREAAGKAAMGRLSFRARAGDNSLTLELADDGRGIDWDAIAAKAKDAGMPYRSQADLFTALLSDGISTKQECTDVSGRGVGMSAVRQRIDGMQGKLEVQSVRGKGTRWVIRFPWSPNAVPTVKLRRSTFPSRRISLEPGSRGRVAS